jgi:hypothetical protein
METTSYAAMQQPYGCMMVSTTWWTGVIEREQWNVLHLGSEIPGRLQENKGLPTARLLVEIVVAWSNLLSYSTQRQGHMMVLVTGAGGTPQKTHVGKWADIESSAHVHSSQMPFCAPIGFVSPNQL